MWPTDTSRMLNSFHFNASVLSTLPSFPAEVREQQTVPTITIIRARCDKTIRWRQEYEQVTHKKIKTRGVIYQTSGHQETIFSTFKDSTQQHERHLQKASSPLCILTTLSQESVQRSL